MAEIPEADPPYHDDLEVVHFVFLHRHGIRSPVKKVLEHLIPTSIWRACSIRPELHASLLSLERTTPQPDTHPGLHSPSHPAKERPMPLSALLFEACSKGPDKCDSVAMEFLTQTYHNPGGECLLGQLTDRGKLGMITLGKRLRERYIDKLGLLPPFLDNLAPISLRSTDYARTLESSQYLMAGLYPLETRNPNLILEYHIADQDSEWLFPSPACKRLEELSAQFTRQVRRELRPEIEAVKRKFPEHFPYDKKDRKRPSSYALHDLFDLNAILRANGLPMVPGFGEADFATVDRIVTESWFRSFREHPEIRSLGAGPMVSNISSILVRAATSPNPKVKFSELSTHDTGVAPLLCALDAFDGRWPNFASNVGFELHRVRSSKPNTGASDHYVRVLYNLRAVNLPWCVKDHYPGDASLCSLKAFKEFADNLMPKDYAEQCAKPVEK